MSSDKFVNGNSVKTAGLRKGVSGLLILFLLIGAMVALGGGVLTKMLSTVMQAHVNIPGEAMKMEQVLEKYCTTDEGSKMMEAPDPTVTVKCGNCKQLTSLSLTRLPLAIGRMTSLVLNVKNGIQGIANIYNVAKTGTISTRLLGVAKTLGEEGGSIHNSYKSIKESDVIRAFATGNFNKDDPMVKVFYSDSNTEKMLESFTKIMEEGGTNIPIGFDTVMVIRNGTSDKFRVDYDAGSNLSLFAEAKNESSAALGKSQILNMKLYQLFTNIFGYTSYADTHFSSDKPKPITYEFSVEEEYVGESQESQGTQGTQGTATSGQTQQPSETVSEFNAKVMLRDEHVKVLSDLMHNPKKNTGFLKSRMESLKIKLAQENPKYVEAAGKLEDEMVKIWEDVSKEVYDDSNENPFGSFHSGVKSLSPYFTGGSQVNDSDGNAVSVCSIEEHLDSSDLLCYTYESMVQLVDDIDNRISGEDGLQKSQQRLLVIRSKVFQILDEAANDNSKCEVINDEQNHLKIPLCAVILSCKYDDSAALNEGAAGCVLMAVNLDKYERKLTLKDSESSKTEEIKFRLNAMPLAPLDYGIASSDFAIALGGIAGSTGAKVVSTIDMAIRGCGAEMLSNKKLVFCFQSKDPSCTMPGMCSTCYQIQCNVEVECKTVGSGNIKIERTSDKLTISGVVEPF